MSFRYTRTRRGFPAVEVGGGWTPNGKIFGTWVLDRKLKLKEAIARTNLVPIVVGDTVFKCEGERGDFRMIALYTQSVRRMRGGWIVGPETTGWHSREVLPALVRYGLEFEALPGNSAHFSAPKEKVIHKYTATGKTFKERTNGRGKKGRGKRVMVRTSSRNAQPDNRGRVSRPRSRSGGA